MANVTIKLMASDQAQPLARHLANTMPLVQRPTNEIDLEQRRPRSPQTLANRPRVNWYRLRYNQSSNGN